FLVVPCSFSGQIEDLYHENNPYHNALHAADVTQATYCLLKRMRVEGFISAFHFMCAILAAICHDIDHPGVNQAFLIETKQMLSIFYEVGSFQVFLHENFRNSRNRFWKIITPMFASQFSYSLESFPPFLFADATDISKQDEYLEQLENLTERRYLCEDYLPTHEDVTLVMEVAIKCADISNPCRHWEACLQWANCITEEFFQQGDRESLLGLPVLPLMDRNKTTKAKVQIGKPPFLTPSLHVNHYELSPFESCVVGASTSFKLWLLAVQPLQNLPSFHSTILTSSLISPCAAGFIQFQVLPLFEQWDAYVRSEFTRSLVAKCKKNLAVWLARDAAATGERRTKLPL
ncbi:High affinity cAMP-specific 3'5'-cyclic phosphodiesterase 7A, partial [Taenia solium]